MEETIKNSGAQKLDVKRLTVLAMLAAVIVLMAFTPIGYLKVGAVSITFIMIPVVIGAVVTGPRGGALLGAVFGITSFIQCFGLDTFGTAMMSINPVFTFLLCMVPRVLMGLLAGMIYKGMCKATKNGILPFAVSCLSGAVLNTVGFVGLFLLLFYSSITALLGTDTVAGAIGLLVTGNALIETGVCLVLGTAIAKGLVHVLPRNK